MNSLNTGLRYCQLSKIFLQVESCGPASTHPAYRMLVRGWMGCVCVVGGGGERKFLCYQCFTAVRFDDTLFGC